MNTKKMLASKCKKDLKMGACYSCNGQTNLPKEHMPCEGKRSVIKMLRI